MNRRELLLRASGLPCLAGALRGEPKLRLTRSEIFTVRIPFAERIRDSWIKSWQNQKRDQTGYALHWGATSRTWPCWPPRAPGPIWIEHSIDNGIAQVFQAHQAAAWPSI